MKDFCWMKHTSVRLKTQSIEWDKVFAILKSVRKMSIYRLYREFL